MKFIIFIIYITNAIQIQDQSQQYLEEEQQQQSMLFKQNNQQKYDSFWFRLSEKTLFYTKDEHDKNVLGAMEVESINLAKGELCFQTFNRFNENWVLCTENRGLFDNWVQSLNYQQVDDHRFMQKNKMEFQVLKPPKVCNEKWDYLQNGLDWKCKCQGIEQSPINLSTELVQFNQLKISSIFTFTKVNKNKLYFVFEQNIIKIKFHDISEDQYNDIDQSNKSFGTIVNDQYVEFRAREIHFHTPSEHQIQGQSYDMEIQIIYYAISEGHIKERAVLCFLVKEKPGGKNVFLDQIDVIQLPSLENLNMPLNYREENVNVEDLFKNDDEDRFYGHFSYLSYMGSMTSPPCFEFYEYFIVKENLNVGFAILNMFRNNIQKGIRHQLQQQQSNNIFQTSTNQNFGNNRNVMPVNLRTVNELNLDNINCYQKIYRKENSDFKTNGHFEKKEITQKQYFYVNSNEPTNLPNSFVVSEFEANNQEIKDDFE